MSRRPLALASLMLAVAALLPGCAAPYRTLPPEQGDKNYQALLLGFSFHARSSAGSSMGASPSKVTIVLRLFDSGGKIGICGFYSVPADFSNTERQFAIDALAQGQLYSGDREVAPTAFLHLQKPGPYIYDAEASCIESSTPFPELDRAQL